MAVLTSTGITFSDATSQATKAPPTPDVQTLLATGTWTKPTSGQTMARIQLWGGGGGGGRSATAGNPCAGGGGGYIETIVLISQVNTQTITIAAGGIGATITGSGGVGGTTTMTVNGASLNAYGGGGGAAANNGGGGGGQLSAGSIGSQGSPILAATAQGAAVFHGALGGVSVASGGTGIGQGSIYGGGGGTAATTAAAGGVSVFGGAGGTGLSGTGQQPGGGGGANNLTANTNGGTGGAGKAVITCW